MTQATYAVLSYQGRDRAGLLCSSTTTARPLQRPDPNDAQPRASRCAQGLLSKLMGRSEAIVEQVEQAATRLNTLLAPDNQRADGQRAGQHQPRADNRPRCPPASRR